MFLEEQLRKVKNQTTILSFPTQNVSGRSTFLTKPYFTAVSYTEKVTPYENEISNFHNKQR